MLDNVIQISFTLKDVFHCFGYVLGICALIYMILTFKELYNVLSKLNKLYSDNENTIKESIEGCNKLIVKAATVSESIPDEPFAFLDTLKAGFPILNTLLSIFKSKTK